MKFPLPCILSLLLAGSAWADDAPRAARSVHLRYEVPAAVVFYNAMIVERSVPGSYFMACGWNAGYFGVQELGNGRKVVIFSVWDPTSEDDPDAVRREDRVECTYQSREARVKRFGGEGTGGQCMADFDWKIGRVIEFAVTAAVEGDRTSYAGYLRKSEQWEHLATFRARNGGQPLRGLYSFIEDFRRDTKSATEVRRARVGRAVVKAADGKWQALTSAIFTASGAEWEAKGSVDAGSDGSWLFLATGGKTRMTTPLGTKLSLSGKDLLAPDVETPGGG